MRKRLICTLIAAMLISSAAVVSAGTISFTDNRGENATATFDESDFETEEFYYENSIGDVSYYVAVTNNSEARQIYFSISISILPNIFFLPE